MTNCLVCNSVTEASQNYTGDACPLLVSSYILAGLAMMLNIRLSYSSAPYALIRFKLPENLFSVFVRRMASALELWCLPSMLLGNIMDLFQKLFNGGAELRAINVKAGDIKNPANQLKSRADQQASGAGATDVSALATDLRNKAQTLSNDATQLPATDGLTDLKDKAQALANAAKEDSAGSTDNTSLHYHANQLQSESGSVDNAIAVIDAFKKVKASYLELSSDNKYSTNKPQSPPGETPQQQKVQAVETAWGNVNSDFQKLCKALIKQYAEPVDTKAGQIPNDPKQFKNAYDKFGKIYDAIPDDTGAKTAVTSDWNDIKNIITEEMKRWKFFWIIVPSIISQWLNFITYVILLIVYVMGADQGHLTTFYFVIAISGVVFGINMTLLYAVDFFYIPVYIVGENSFPIVTSFIHYVSTLVFGNRRKWNSDFLLVAIDIVVAIIISLVAAVVWTYGYLCEIDSSTEFKNIKHIFAFGFGGEPHWEQLSPFLMIVVGMGLVYAIYPGIAPGMIVPFYLVDKIEMVLLVATLFPPVIIALLRRYKADYSPQYNKFGIFQKWSEYNAGRFYLFLDVLMIIKICLAAIFIYSLHYRESNLSRSIINQPKMSTFLSIVFYMCHEILLALGFSGFIGNNGGDYILIPQYIGALFMIFLAFYSEGYIIEYKSHDPAHWPTEGMTPWNAFCYWCKRASKITNHNLMSLFTTESQNYLHFLFIFKQYYLDYTK